MELNNKWLLTCDDDKWSDDSFGDFETKEEAISFIQENGAKELYNIWLADQGEENLPESQDEVTFYIGQVLEFFPNICVDNVLDDIVEKAYEHGGEYAEGYLENVSKSEQSELEDALNSVLENWINKYNFKPHFYQIASTEEITLRLKKEN